MIIRVNGMEIDIQVYLRLLSVTTENELSVWSYHKHFGKYEKPSRGHMIRKAVSLIKQSLEVNRCKWSAGIRAWVRHVWQLATCIVLDIRVNRETSCSKRTKCRNIKKCVWQVLFILNYDNIRNLHLKLSIG